MLNVRDTLRRRASLLLMLAGLAVVAGILIHQGTDEFVVPTAIGDTNDAAQISEDFKSLERANRAFINLVARTRPSIVQITSKIEQQVSQTNHRIQIWPNYRLDNENHRRLLEDEDFRRMLEERNIIPNIPEWIPTDPPPTIESQQVGSGVIVSDDGYILTNSHVVDKAKKITVTLPDGKEYDAELIGRDPGGDTVSGTDLAVLKIDAKGLPVLPFGDSDALEVGEWVIAIGTPYNLSQTVTRGIVSAKDRVSTRIQYSNFIQTDAPINHGNSGGALINIRGELVGINTLIATNGLNSGNIGIGFAIPSNTAQRLLPQLIEDGEIVRGWLGVSMETLSHELAEKYKLDSTYGVLVNEVGMGSPAQKGGLQRGDIILEFNNETVRDSSHLMHAVGATPVGTSVDIKILRNKKEKMLTVKLDKRTEEAIASLRSNAASDFDPTPTKDKSDTDSFAGMHVQKLTTELARRYRYQDETGVIVTRVDRDSPAAKNGIQVGYLVKEIDYQPINNLKDFRRVVKELKESNDKVALVYLKGLNGRGNYHTLRIHPEVTDSDDR